MPTLKANIAGTWTPIGYAPPGRFTATADGVVPLSGGGTLNFLRADGTWGVPAGGALPAGGVLGDILIKNSATAGDARWGINPPTLTLGGTTAATPDTLTLLDSTHATSRRAGILFGSAWEIQQDSAANGTKDFRIYQRPNARVPLSISADGLTVGIGTVAGSVIQLGSGSDARVRVGDDTELFDTQLVSTLGLRSTSDGAWGKLKLGNAGPIITGGPSYYQLSSPSLGYYDANVHYFRTAAGVDLGRYDGTNWVFNAGSVYLDGHLLVGNARWVYIRGSGTGLIWEQFGGGVMMDGSAQVKIYGSKELWAQNKIESTKTAGGAYWDQCFYADPGGTMAGYGWHPGGVAGSLRMQVNADNFHFNNTDSSWYYNCIAKSFGVASSQRGKQDLVPLIDVLPALPLHPVATMVRGLHPKWWRTREEYTMKEVPPCPDDVDPSEWRPDTATMPNHVCRTEGKNACGHTPDDPCCWRVNWLRGQLGFVAEEVEQVLPQLVLLDADMKPAAISLGSLIGLAYAMLQELDTRLTAVEAA